MYDNWNTPKKAKMNAVQSDIDAIYSNVQTYDNKGKSVQSSLNTFKGSL